MAVSPRTVVALAALLAGLGVAVVVAQGVRHGLTLVHPTRYRVTPAETARARAALPKLEEVTLHTADGLALRGWFAPGPLRSVVIFVHGLWGNRMSLEPEAALMAKHGHGVLLFDSRASGDSEGTVATWGDRDQLDARAAVDFVLTRPEVDPTRVAMLGFSVGASTVALASARDPRVRAVILYATWIGLGPEMRTKSHKLGPLSWGPVLLTMRWEGIDPARVDPIDHIAEIAPRPLLMITGTADSDTPVWSMRQLFARAGEPKDLWIVEGSEHGRYLATAPAEYERRVVQFLDRALPGSKTRDD